jgi:hypothetical protein
MGSLLERLGSGIKRRAQYRLVQVLAATLAVLAKAIPKLLPSFGKDCKALDPDRISSLAGLRSPLQKNSSEHRHENKADDG